MGRPGDARKQQAATASAFVLPAHAGASDDTLYDYRFRRLIAPDDWAALPDTVRRRFSKRLTGVAVATYDGAIVATRMSALGWMLAQGCRLIGAPLPTHRDADVPAVVSVSEDRIGGGQIWTRVYGRTQGFPQVIHSAKRFAGTTGLEEHIGGGFGMALAVRAEGDALLFTSDHYFWTAGGFRVRLPRWLAPGRTVVTHRDLGGGRFAFDLELTHRWFGVLMHQQAIFHD